MFATIGRRLIGFIALFMLLPLIAACSGTAGQNARAIATTMPAIIGAADQYDQSMASMQPADCATNCASDTIDLVIKDGNTILDKANPAEFKAGSAITLTTTLPQQFTGGTITWCLPDGTIIDGDTATFYAPDVTVNTTYKILIKVVFEAKVYYYTVVIIVNPSGNAPAATPAPTSPSAPTATATALPTAAATAMPTSAPATATAAPIVNTCPWTDKWSKEDDAPLEGNRWGSDMFNTLFQGWIPGRPETSIEIYIPSGMQIDLPIGYTGTIWYTCNDESDRAAQMTTEMKDNNSLDFVPELLNFVKDSAAAKTTLDAYNAKNATTLNVVTYVATGATIDPTLNDPFASEEFAVAPSATTLLGDQFLWTIVTDAHPFSRSDIKLTVRIAPGFAVRFTEGWLGNKAHAKAIDGHNSAEPQTHEIVIDSEDDFTQLDQFQLTGKVFIGQR